MSAARPLLALVAALALCSCACAARAPRNGLETLRYEEAAYDSLPAELRVVLRDAPLLDSEHVVSERCSACHALVHRAAMQWRKVRPVARGWKWGRGARDSRGQPGEARVVPPMWSAGPRGRPQAGGQLDS